MYLIAGPPKGLPPDGYLREAARLCKKENVLFVADEIQSGLGRTGKLFAFEHEQVRPDMVIIGKALGGGFYPISAVLSSKEVLGVFNPGDHGSTFGGNPLAAAVAVAALDVLVKEKLVKRSMVLGELFMEQLRAMKNPHIQLVRGRGLWIGLVLDIKARPYCEALMKRGVLCKETHENVIRFAPPLVIKKSEVQWVCKQISAVMRELS